jgi:hypothetical protein
MALVRAVLNPLLFGLVGLLFVLPFAVVAIEPEEEQLLITETWFGADLVVGPARGQPRMVVTEFDGTVHDLRGSELKQLQGGMINPDESLVLPRQPALMVAALGVLAGVLAGLLPGVRTRRRVSVVAASISVGALAIGLWLLLSQLQRQFGTHLPYLSYRPGSGYWLAVSLLVLLGLGNTVALYQLRAGDRALADEPGEQPTA